MKRDLLSELEKKFLVESDDSKPEDEKGDSEFVFTKDKFTITNEFLSKNPEDREQAYQVFKKEYLGLYLIEVLKTMEGYDTPEKRKEYLDKHGIDKASILDNSITYESLVKKCEEEETPVEEGCEEPCEETSPAPSPTFVRRSYSETTSQEKNTEQWVDSRIMLLKKRGIIS